MNGAVDHVRPDMDAEQSDDQDPESVPHDPQRNHEGHQHEPAPRALEKEVGGEQARDEEHPTGADPAALLGDPAGRSRAARTPCRRARSGVPVILKNKAATSADASTEAVSSQFTAASGSGTMKIRNADGKGRGGHPFRAKEQKPAGGDEAHIGERHQGEIVVDAQALRARRSLRPAPPRRFRPG